MAAAGAVVAAAAAAGQAGAPVQWAGAGEGEEQAGADLELVESDRLRLVIKYSCLVVQMTYPSGNTCIKLRK